MPETDAPPVDRYAILEAFVAEWYRPIQPEDGYTEAEIVEAEGQLGFRLPEALREFYGLIGRNDELTGRQNYLASLDEDGIYPIAFEDGFLLFWLRIRIIGRWRSASCVGSVGRRGGLQVWCGTGGQRGQLAQGWGVQT
jgi:hypothetical protein